MSMEVFYRPNDKFTFKIECKDIDELFDELGQIQEIMGSCKCGKCKGTNIRFMHRKVDKHDFYELVCQDCYAKLALGRDQENKALFPRRYKQDPDDPKKPLLVNGKKVFLPDSGWVKWDAEKHENV